MTPGTAGGELSDRVVTSVQLALQPDKAAK